MEVRTFYDSMKAKRVFYVLFWIYDASLFLSSLGILLGKIIFVKKRHINKPHLPAWML